MDPILRLIRELTRLPGIGEKSATRLAYHMMNWKTEDTTSLANAIVDMKKRIKFCSQCFNLTEKDPCIICADPRRNKSIVCVVEYPQDAAAIEKTGAFSGVYHILHGVISPLDGIGPDDIKISGLLTGIKKRCIHEVIIATNPTTEGETTSLYITKLLGALDVKLSRIAFGIPFGGDIEYTDKATLSRALELRSELKK